MVQDKSMRLLPDGGNLLFSDTDAINMSGKKAIHLLEQLFSVPVVLFAAIQRGDLLHFLLCQLKAKQIQVLPDVIRVRGTGNHHHAALQIPAEDDLRAALWYSPVRPGDTSIAPQCLSPG